VGERVLYVPRRGRGRASLWGEKKSLAGDVVFSYYSLRGEGKVEQEGPLEGMGREERARYYSYAGKGEKRVCWPASNLVGGGEEKLGRVRDTFRLLRGWGKKGRENGTVFRIAEKKRKGEKM